MLGLDLGLTSVRGGAWWPQGAVYAADFVGDRYMRNGNAIAAAEAYSFARASSKWARNAAGEWTQFAPDRLARTDLGASIEPAGSNIVPNAALAGAAVGVLGAGGSLPTGWYTNNVLTTEVIAVTTLAGLPAIRIRVSGTATGTFYELNMMPAATPLAASTAYAASVFVQMHDPSVPVIELRQATDTDAFVAANAFLPSAGTAAERIGRTFTSLPTSVRSRLRVTFVLATGTLFGSEFTVACPQLEVGDKPTSPMTAVRAPDDLALVLPADSHILQIEHDDGSTTTTPADVGSYSIGTTQPRALIRRTIASSM